MIVTVDGDLSQDQVAYIKQHIQQVLELPDDVRLIVATRMKFQIVTEDA
jgi:hypothetical protein